MDTVTLLPRSNELQHGAQTLRKHGKHIEEYAILKNLRPWAVGR